MINLFKAYQVGSDREFVRYIKTKWDECGDGYKISTDELINSALNKFEILSKDNKWNSISTEKYHIITIASVI